jgi:hypothetical protein
VHFEEVILHGMLLVDVLLLLQLSLNHCYQNHNWMLKKSDLTSFKFDKLTNKCAIEGIQCLDHNNIALENSEVED